MNQQFRHKSFTAGGPLASALVVIVGVLVIALSLVLGFVAFIALALFVLITAAAMSVRAWWLRRKFGGKQRQGQTRSQSARDRSPAGIIEGEYHEVADDTDREDRR